MNRPAASACSSASHPGYRLPGAWRACEFADTVMLRRYVTSLVSRPKTVILAVSVITLFLGFNISRLKVLLDVDSQIPPGHPFVAVGKRVEKLFGGKYMTVMGIYPAEGSVYTPKILGKVKRLTDAVEALPGVKQGTVLSLMSSRVKDIHSTEDALEITPLAPKIPETDAEMAKFRERVKANALRDQPAGLGRRSRHRGVRGFRRLREGRWQRASLSQAGRHRGRRARARRRGAGGGHVQHPLLAARLHGAPDPSSSCSRSRPSRTCSTGRSGPGRACSFRS